jgi:hypothetical protein
MERNHKIHLQDTPYGSPNPNIRANCTPADQLGKRPAAEIHAGSFL